MAKVVVSRVISAPPPAVWEVFADLAGHRSWLSDVENVELTTAGPVGVGTRWRETRVDATDRRVSEELEIIALEPGRSCTIALAGGDGSASLTYVFTPVDVGTHRGGTAVTAVAQGRPVGRASRLLAFFMGGFVARTAEGALRNELASLAAACTTRGAVGPAAA